MIASFLVDDINKKFSFFEKIFLLADISIDIVLGMLFLTLSNIKVNFNNQELKYKLYTLAKALSTIKYIDIIRKKEFAITALDPDNEIFVVYIASLICSNLGLKVYLS